MDAKQQHSSDNASIDLEEDFATSTSCHGVGHIFANVGSRRSMWFTITVICSVACIGQCFIIVYDASFLPTRVNIKLEYNTESLFPSVTICNTNLVASLSIGDIEYKNALALYRYYYIKDTSTFKELQEAEQFFTRVYGKNFTIDDYIAKYRFRIEDMIISCRWDSRPCGPQNFTQTVTDYGICYTFNSGQGQHPLLYQRAGGTFHGLKLILNVQQYLYPTYPISFQAPDAGIRLSIHSYNEIPNMDSQGVFVPPGAHSYVSIDGTHLFSSLSPPWGQCGEKKLKYFRHYSRSACRRELEADMALDSCNCNYRHRQSNKPICSVQQLFDCVIPKLTSGNGTANVSRSCPHPCQQTDYPIILSYAGIANYATFEFARNDSILANLLRQQKLVNISAQSFIRENLVYLDVYFRELITSMTIESKATGYAQVLSDIGGQLGLFVGASIITLCEIITYFCDRCKRDKRKKEMQHRQNQIRNSIALNMTNKPKHEELNMKRTNSSATIYNDSHKNSDNENRPTSINGIHV